MICVMAHYEILAELVYGIYEALQKAGVLMPGLLNGAKPPADELFPGSSARGPRSAVLQQSFQMFAHQSADKCHLHECSRSSPFQIKEFC